MSKSRCKPLTRCSESLPNQVFSTWLRQRSWADVRFWDCAASLALYLGIVTFSMCEKCFLDSEFLRSVPLLRAYMKKKNDKNTPSNGAHGAMGSHGIHRSVASGQSFNVSIPSGRKQWTWREPRAVKKWQVVRFGTLKTFAEDYQAITKRVQKSINKTNLADFRVLNLQWRSL